MNEKWLLLRHDKAGDALKTLPVLRALRLEAPRPIDVHVLASENNASLFLYEPGIHLHVLPKNWKRMKRETLLAAAKITESFDVILNLLTDPTDEADQLLGLIPAARKLCVALKGNSATLHAEVTRLVLPATPIGRNETENIAVIVGQAMDFPLHERLVGIPPGPVLGPEDFAEARDKMGMKQGTWLGFCPFAGTGHRTPPLKRWEKFLAKATREERYEKYFLFGTPSDYKNLDRLRSIAAVPERVELCFPSSFRALGAYLRRLDGVVAVESGPLHLARSLGVKSLGILSGGDPRRWFSPVMEGDVLLRRGLFNRFPTVFEMVWAYDRWKPVTAEVS